MAPIDHLGGDAVLIFAGIVGIVAVRVADAVVLVLGIPQGHPIALTPVPVPRQEPVNRRGLSSKRDIASRHLRRHDADEIVLADDAIERLDERTPDVVRGGDVHVIGIEEEHEQARARALGHRARLGHRVRLHARLLRTGGADDDAFELLDCLWDAALEDLELLLSQIRQRRTVFRGVDVNAHVVRFGTKRRLWDVRLCRLRLLGLLRLLRRPAEARRRHVRNRECSRDERRELKSEARQMTAFLVTKVRLTATGLPCRFEAELRYFDGRSGTRFESISDPLRAGPLSADESL